MLWCGNIIAKDCCIKRAGEHARHWDIINIRGKDGRSTWPQKNTEEQIDTVLSNISARSAQAEYFNNPVSEGTVFKNLPFGKVPPLEKFPFLVAYGDPAYSDSRKKASSTKAVFLIGRLKGVYYIIKGFLARELNAVFISWYFDLADYVGGRTNVYCYMENNKLQDPFFEQVFKPLLREEARRRGRSSISVATSAGRRTRRHASRRTLSLSTGTELGCSTRRKGTTRTCRSSSASSGCLRCTFRTMPTDLTA